MNANNTQIFICDGKDYQKARKWLEEQTEDFQEQVGDYLKSFLENNLVHNQQEYARATIVEIWKQQNGEKHNGEKHNTSFRYDIGRSLYKTKERLIDRMLRWCFSCWDKRMHKRKGVKRGGKHRLWFTRK